MLEASLIFGLHLLNMNALGAFPFSDSCGLLLPDVRSRFLSVRGGLLFLFGFLASLSEVIRCLTKEAFVGLLRKASFIDSWLLLMSGLKLSSL